MNRRQRPPKKQRRASFHRTAREDIYLSWLRRDTRATDLGEIDWMLHQTNCNPYRAGQPAHRAYELGFARAKRQDPTPASPALQDLPHLRTTSERDT